MSNKIYVGNLSYSTSEDQLSDLFSQHGEVTSCRVITDRDSGRSKGFAFVEMATDQQAEQAIQSLGGQELEGRALNVSEARPQAPRSSGGGFGSGGGRSSGYGRGASSRY